MNEQTRTIIETQGLSRRYRRCEALTGLDLRVDEGSIFAYLGPNGAGKTTTIKLLLNLIAPTGGSASVFGVPSARLGRSEFARIGYVSADQKQPDWMTVDQVLRYLSGLYPEWDDAFCKYLVAQFDLPGDRKLKELSRGMRMKAALVGALAYRPRLLVLDEPFSGLDPLVRDEFLQGIVELTQQERWTIFVSTHDIDEVERLADRVGILNQGRLELAEDIESLLGRFRRVSCTWPGEGTLNLGLPDSWLRPSQSGRRVEFVDSRFDPETLSTRLQTALPGARDEEVTELTLKEIFLALAREFRLTDRMKKGA